jgi:catechol 2,3-dioxygenase-like lactoylglutathione lyase family enzyme
MNLKLDHVNLRTTNVDLMVDWYGRVLGLKPAPRPGFPFPGAWLSAGNGDAAAVHVVGVETPPGAYDAAQQLEHFAFTATGLKDFLAHLRAEKVAYYCRVLPDTDARQINFHDCDGNHLHVDFLAIEEADLTAYDGR